MAYDRHATSPRCLGQHQQGSLWLRLLGALPHESVQTCARQRFLSSCLLAAMRWTQTNRPSPEKHRERVAYDNSSRLCHGCVRAPLDTRTHGARWERRIGFDVHAVSLRCNNRTVLLRRSGHACECVSLGPECPHRLRAASRLLLEALVERRRSNWINGWVGTAIGANSDSVSLARKLTSC